MCVCPLVHLRNTIERNTCTVLPHCEDVEFDADDCSSHIPHQSVILCTDFHFSKCCHVSWTDSVIRMFVYTFWLQHLCLATICWEQTITSTPTSTVGIDWKCETLLREQTLSGATRSWRICAYATSWSTETSNSVHSDSNLRIGASIQTTTIFVRSRKRTIGTQFENVTATGKRLIIGVLFLCAHIFCQNIQSLMGSLMAYLTHSVHWIRPWNSIRNSNIVVTTLHHHWQSSNLNSSGQSETRELSDLSFASIGTQQKCTSITARKLTARISTDLCSPCLMTNRHTY